MFGMNGFGGVGDLMFLQSTVEKDEVEKHDFTSKEELIIKYAIEAFGSVGGDNLEKCIDYGYEMADAFPDDFDDETNDAIYDEIKECYDNHFA